MKLSRCFLPFLLNFALLSVTLLLVAAGEQRKEPFDPYRVLGVTRKSNMGDIKKQYRKLAKELHPDKNPDQDDQEKFLDLVKAYDILSDPDRRKKFDQFGIHEDQPNFRKQPDYSQFGRFDFMDDFLHQFHEGGGQRFSFNFGKPEMDYYRKMTLSAKQYFNQIVPNSKQKPCLIIFYSDWCRVCQQMEPIWRKVEEDMTFSGIEVGAVHSGLENDLAKQLGVSDASMIFVADGRTWKYKENVVSALSIIQFVRSKFPRGLIKSLTASSLEQFLSGWASDNKPRAVIIGQLEKIRLRYLTTALAFEDWFTFGYVQAGTDDGIAVMQKANVVVRHGLDAVLVFNENHHRPIATLSMPDIPVRTLKDVLNSHKYLILPRLSSQAIFDAVCPPEKSRFQKRLCVILITSDSPAHEPYRSALRDYVSTSDFVSRLSEKVRFLYVFAERQSEFMRAVTKPGDGAPDSPELHMVILWRQEEKKAQFEWVPTPWLLDQLNSSTDELEKLTKKLLKEDSVLNHEAVMHHLLDEHARGFFGKIADKITFAWDVISESTSKEDVLPAVSVLATILFILGVGWFMSHMVKMEEEKIAKSKGGSGSTATGAGTSAPKIEPQLKIHELRGETYNGLVRLLKPGCRTIVLILDNESKGTLLPKFHRTVWPYRKNKSLMYAFVNVQRGLDWFKKLLLLSFPELEERDLKINPKNVVGTVLALNGHRKYFCMYHAKHRDQPGRANRGFFEEAEEEDSDGEYDPETAVIRRGRAMSREAAENDEALLDQYDSDVLFLEHLLDGLPTWLDRLFEGTTQRYHINYWPDYIGK